MGGVGGVGGVGGCVGGWGGWVGVGARGIGRRAQRCTHAPPLPAPPPNTLPSPLLPLCPPSPPPLPRAEPIKYQRGASKLLLIMQAIAGLREAVTPYNHALGLMGKRHPEEAAVVRRLVAEPPWPPELQARMRAAVALPQPSAEIEGYRVAGEAAALLTDPEVHAALEILWQLHSSSAAGGWVGGWVCLPRRALPTPLTPPTCPLPLPPPPPHPSTPRLRVAGAAGGSRPEEGPRPARADLQGAGCAGARRRRRARGVFGGTEAVLARRWCVGGRAGAGRGVSGALKGGRTPTPAHLLLTRAAPPPPPTPHAHHAVRALGDALVAYGYNRGHGSGP